MLEEEFTQSVQRATCRRLRMPILQAWLDAHPDQYLREPTLAFRQVHLSPERGARLEDDARQMLARLTTAAANANLEIPGDSRLLPANVERSSRSDVARLFGEQFADRILEAQPGRWIGPIPSAYGVHLVFVTERFDGRHVRDRVADRGSGP